MAIEFVVPPPKGIQEAGKIAYLYTAYPAQAIEPGYKACPVLDGECLIRTECRGNPGFKVRKGDCAMITEVVCWVVARTEHLDAKLAQNGASREPIYQ